MNLTSILVEIPIVSLFTLFIIYLIKKDRKNLKLVFYLIIYAFLFENLSIILSENGLGGYFYNSEFIFVGHVPLFVILSWSMIIYSSMLITDSFSFSNSSKPFVDALLTVLVDLSVDVPAIRLGFWTWIGYSSYDGWFGVPANNFIGWLLISFTFCYLWRKYSKRIRFLTIPLAYLMCLVMFIFFIQPLELVLKLSKNQEMIPFAILIMGFLLIIRLKNKKIKSLGRSFLIVHLLRTPFFVFGIISILVFGFYQESILLFVSSLVWFLIEFMILLLHSKKLNSLT